MARPKEVAAVYAAAIIQGIVSVTFPAVSSIFTSPNYFALSATQYGGMFVPQAITAILASLAGAELTRHIGGKRILVIGLLANMLGMGLLFGSQFSSRFAGSSSSLAYPYLILLCSTAFLGIGFGFTVPALNTFTAALFPEKVDRAILTLNALLGLGTALAPVFATLFIGFGIWWGLPILMSGLLLVLIFFCLPLPWKEKSQSSPLLSQGKAPIPSRFWIYAAFALFYGICETMNANWATVYMASKFEASTAIASLALTLFWIAVTGGRILFAAIEKACPPRWTYRILPFLIALAFILTAGTSRHHPYFALVSFSLAGLGCSALLPLVISFGQAELLSMSTIVAGGLIGFYEMGYGLAAFGAGPLQTWAKLNLTSIYGGMSVCAVGMGLLAFLISRTMRTPPAPLREDLSAKSMRPLIPQ